MNGKEVMVRRRSGAQQWRWWTRWISRTTNAS